MDYLLVLLATVLLAGEFVCSKHYQALQGVSLGAGLRFSALSGLLSAVLMLAVLGFRVPWSAFSAVMALASAACVTAYSLLSFRVLKRGGMALYSTFLMSGGMLLPYFFGIVFLNERLTVLRIAGVAVMLAAVILANFRREKADGRLLALCAAVFVLNGCVSIVSKCHQVADTFTVDSSAFVLYCGVAKMLLSGIALLFCRRQKAAMPLRAAGLVLGAAAIGGVSYLLQLVGAKNLPASVLYPMVTGGCIVFSALAGRLFFGERISKRQTVSIALCMLGTLLFL